MKKNYYAVKKGKVTGIFKSWAECKDSVDGFSGAQYKGFVTLSEAEEYMGIGTSEQEISETEDAAAYVDGSYNIKTKNFACGVVMLINGEEITFNQAYDDEELAKMRNVAGEICGSILAMRYCTKNSIDTLHLYYDYEGIEKWCTGVWKATKPGTIRYKEFYDSIKSDLRVIFHKVKGHSGDKYNDMADRLAKDAAGIE